MKWRVVFLTLAGFLALTGSYHLLREAGRTVPAVVEPIEEPAPTFVESTSISMESSNVVAESFLETFESEPEVLFELHVDDRAVERLREMKRSDWIDVTTFSAIAYEITMREPHFAYVGVRWKINGRETNAQKKLVFHWPFALPSTESRPPVINRYDHLPVPPGATAVCADFDLYDLQNLRKISNLRVLGYRTTTSHTKIAPIVLESPATNGARVVRFEFPSFTEKDRQGRVHGAGARLRLHGVSKVRVLTRDHSIRELDEIGEWTLGSFLPHQVQFTDAKGDVCSVRVNHADMLQLRTNPDAGTLEVKAYYYHHAERYVTSHQEEVRFTANGQVGWRQHVNKGAATSMAAGSLTITVAKSKDFFTPLWQPQGRLATFVFVEHADYQEPESDVLVMYGNANKKTVPGLGFVGNRLALTKTIFLIGETSPFTKKIDGVDFQFERVSFLGDPKWRELLLKYQADGIAIEFGAHTPAAQSTAKAESLLALRELSSLGGGVWTDHGSVLANICRNGWNDKDENNFMLAALKAHRIRYINALNETYVDKGATSLSQVLDNAPTPLLFSIPPSNRRGVDDSSLYIFTTLADGISSLPRTSPDSVQQFVRERSIALHHCYLARECLDIRLDSDGRRVMTLRPEANRGMQALAKARDAGDLYVSTVSDWADYVRGVRALSIIQVGDDITVENPGKGINDVSFMISGTNRVASPARLLFDGKEIVNARCIDGATYFFADVTHGKHWVKRLP